MDLELVKKLINELQSSTEYKKYVKRGRKAENYYVCKNDILKRARHGHPDDVFKKANHKIASPFFKMLLMQKSSYIFGTPPEIDVGNEEINDRIRDILGAQWGKNLKKLCDIVSMWGDGWIQYWIDDNGEFQWGVINHSEEILAGWGGLLNEELIYCVKKAINWIDPDTAECWDLYELWTSENCSFYRCEHTGDMDLTELQEERRQLSFDVNTNEFQESNLMSHDYGEVPFIYFRNNSMALNDLVGIKESIDAYDEARSSLADDIEDCDETIFVLSNNGRQDPREFWDSVSKNRLISLVSDPIDGEIGKSDVKMMTIEPPIAAKQLAMETNKEDILNLGGGVDPNPEVLSSTSGEALKYRYNMMELKASQLEDEFRIGIDRLVKAILRYLGYELPVGVQIKQTWKRTKINNDTELITNVKNSVGILSNETLLRHHPWVENVDDELELLDIEQREQENQAIARAQQDLINTSDPYGRNNSSGQGLLDEAIQAIGGSES